MYVIRCPESSLKFGDSLWGRVCIQWLGWTDSISGLQPKEIQFNCNKAFWKAIFALSATRFTTIFHKTVSKPHPNNFKRRFCTGLWIFLHVLTYLCIYYLLTNSTTSCKPQLWNINYRTVWLESKGFTYINPAPQWKKNQDRSIEFVCLGFFRVFFSLWYSPLNFSWILSVWNFSY